MSLDPLLPIAPARVKALLLPLGKIKAARFASFAERLQAEHVVQLRDISADGRPNRSKYMHVHTAGRRGGEVGYGEDGMERSMYKAMPYRLLILYIYSGLDKLM